MRVYLCDCEENVKKMLTEAIERKYVIIRICPQLYFSDTLFS